MSLLSSRDVHSLLFTVDTDTVSGNRRGVMALKAGKKRRFTCMVGKQGAGEHVEGAVTSLSTVDAMTPLVLMS